MRKLGPRVACSLFACSILLLAAFPPSLPQRPLPSSRPAPATETLKYGDLEVVVERKATATAAEVQLPFYQGAKLREGYTRRLSKKQDGKQLSYFAVAVLRSSDAPEKVAADYSRRLPGKPKPERVTDKLGTRLVLAISSKEEVRVVTITSPGEGLADQADARGQAYRNPPRAGGGDAPDPAGKAHAAAPTRGAGTGLPPPPLSIPPGGSEA